MFWSLILIFVFSFAIFVCYLHLDLHKNIVLQSFQCVSDVSHEQVPRVNINHIFTSSTQEKNFLNTYLTV
jgi:hypothetical protein